MIAFALITVALSVVQRAIGFVEKKTLVSLLILIQYMVALYVLFNHFLKFSYEL
jgi:hypothetical protein